MLKFQEYLESQEDLVTLALWHVQPNISNLNLTKQMSSRVAGMLQNCPNLESREHVFILLDQLLLKGQQAKWSGKSSGTYNEKSSLVAREWPSEKKKKKL